MVVVIDNKKQLEFFKCYSSRDGKCYYPGQVYKPGECKCEGNDIECEYNTTRGKIGGST